METNGGESDDPVLSWRIPQGENSRRLDLHLARQLGVSRGVARRLLAEGRIWLDGRQLPGKAKGQLAVAGAELRVEGFCSPGRQRPLPDPEDGELSQELASGPGWVAVDKPPGCGVHPLHQGQRGTLLNGLVRRYPQIIGVGEGGLRSGVVHRLDVDTSGVVLFALDANTWSKLRAAFRAGGGGAPTDLRLEKRYRAVVEGRLVDGGEMELELAVVRRSPALVRVFASGAPRRTWTTRLRWRSLAASNAASLVEVYPSTGFLHQIRVTLAYLGHPVVGDRVYGQGREGARHLLHAAGLRWDALPGLDVSSPDPPDFRAALERWGLVSPRLFSSRLVGE